MTDLPNNPYANPIGTAAQLSPAEEKQWAILTHVLGIFFGFISAIVIYVLFKDRGPFIRAHAITEWNLQLTMLILQFLGFALSFSSFFSSFGAQYSGSAAPPSLGLFFVGYFLLIGLRVLSTIFGIIASVAANRGNYYRYPIAFRFAK
jgi:uncharacterized protein